MALFIAMNHFQVDPERGAEFEAHWRQRETYLAEASCASRAARRRAGQLRSLTWQSAPRGMDGLRLFCKAHAQARTPAGLLRGHPRLELFEAVIEQ
jgi:hypothetical protein